jgi:YD repeat-containing protein
VTQTWYDWRDRAVAVKQGVQATEAITVNRPLTVTTYDNLNEVVMTQVYDGDGITPTIVAGVLVLPSGTASKLRAQTTASYDETGEVYRSQVYSVDPATGLVSTISLRTNDFYDLDGNEIAESAPGGLWTKTIYNGVGNPVVVYQTDGAGDSVTTWGTLPAYIAATTVQNDHVYQQVTTVYDGDNNVIKIITGERFNDATLTGALGNSTSTTSAKARVSYEAYYYDSADRLIASLDVGTAPTTISSGGWVRPSTPPQFTLPPGQPARTNTALVTTYNYAADAVQDISFSGIPTGGWFTISFGNATTISLPYNSTAGYINTQLSVMSTIGLNNSVVTPLVGGGWQIRFTGNLGQTYQPQIQILSSSVTGANLVVSTLSLGGDAGFVADAQDPDGYDTRTYYDSLGRAVQTVEAFTDGRIPISSTSNKTTDFAFNSVGIVSQTAELGGGSGETTLWKYGVSTTANTSGNSSAIDSNDIVGMVEEPDPFTGAPSTTYTYIYTVDALGETETGTDPNGTTHQYTYDVLGRETADSVTNFGQ